MAEKYFLNVTMKRAAMENDIERRWILRRNRPGRVLSPTCSPPRAQRDCVMPLRKYPARPAESVI